MTLTPYSLPQRPTTILASKELNLFPQALGLPVSHVVVAGYSTPDDLLFHFCLSLVNGQPTDPKSATIRLNMQPSYTDLNHFTRGVLLVEWLPEGDSNSPMDTLFMISVRDGVVARDICKYLLDDIKMDHYDFSADGTGCRHWCATVLEHLAAGGFVDTTAGQMFEAYEAREAVKWNTKFPMPRIKGTFYNA